MKLVNLNSPTCSTCGGILYYWEDGGITMVACRDCGEVMDKGVKEDLEHWLNNGYYDFEREKEKEEPKQEVFYTMKEAYEANKRRDKCIVCGANTYKKDCFTSVISYCDCVEKL